MRTCSLFTLGLLAFAFWSGCQSTPSADRPDRALFTVGSGKDGRLTPRDKFTAGETVQLYLDGYPDRDAVAELWRDGKILTSKPFRIPPAKPLSQSRTGLMYDQLGRIRPGIGARAGTVAECFVPLYNVPAGEYETVIKINDVPVANTRFSVVAR